MGSRGGGRRRSVLEKLRDKHTKFVKINPSCCIVYRIGGRACLNYLRREILSFDVKNVRYVKTVQMETNLFTVGTYDLISHSFKKLFEF